MHVEIERSHEHGRDRWTASRCCRRGVLQAIVDAVTKALRDGDEREKRAMSERKITDGVSAERDEAR